VRSLIGGLVAAALLAAGCGGLAPPGTPSDRGQRTPTAQFPPPSAPGRGDDAGDLFVKSEPPGAQVWLDGRERAERTPITLEGVAVGEHVLALRAGDRGREGRIVVKAGGFTRVAWELPRLKGRLKILSSPPEAELLLDGREEGTTPLVLDVEAGEHALVLGKPGFVPLKRGVKVRPGEETRVDVVLERFVFPNEGDVVEIPGFDGLTLVRIPGGEFLMGSIDRPGDDEEPVHLVRVRSFRISRTEVTQAQWARVMGGNPSRFNGCAECPVERVSWDDVQGFLRKASRLIGLSFRLPTEAEWEYAAGGGERHQKWAGTDSKTDLESYAWYGASSGDRVRPAGEKKPNAFGLHDMSGNVWEWCADWYNGTYYAESPVDDPQGPSVGWGHTLRGGGWYDDAGDIRVANRFGREPGLRNHNVGFRLVVPAAP
jgi:formylglycine-generating enzyme required for sulfatase activity